MFFVSWFTLERAMGWAWWACIKLVCAWLMTPFNWPALGWMLCRVSAGQSTRCGRDYNGAAVYHGSQVVYSIDRDAGRLLVAWRYRTSAVDRQLGLSVSGADICNDRQITRSHIWNSRSRSSGSDDASFIIIHRPAYENLYSPYNSSNFWESFEHRHRFV